MTKPQLVKVEALFYVLQQVIKRSCAYFDTAPCCQTISAAADVCAIAYVTDCDRGSSCISCLIRRDMDRYGQCAGLL